MKRFTIMLSSFGMVTAMLVTSAFAAVPDRVSEGLGESASVADSALTTDNSGTITYKDRGGTMTLHRNEVGEVISGTYVFRDGDSYVTEVLSQFVYSQDRTTVTCSGMGNNGATSSYTFRTTDYRPIKSNWESADGSMHGHNLWNYEEDTYEENLWLDFETLNIVKVKRLSSGEYQSSTAVNYKDGEEIYREECTDYVYSEENTFFCSYSASDGRTGTKWVRYDEQGNENEYRNVWVNEFKDSSGEVTYTEAGYRQEDSWYWNPTHQNKYHEISLIDEENNWHSISTQVWVYDEEELLIRYETVTWDYDDEAGEYTLHYERSDGNSGSSTWRYSEDHEECISEEWTNANEGSHGAGWLEENGCWTSENWWDSDAQYHKETRNRETDQIVSREHRECDEDGNLRWWSREYDFEYTDGACSYRFEQLDGRTGQRRVYLTEDDEECIYEEWVNKSEGSHGVGSLDENGFWTDVWENNTEYHKETRNLQTDQIIYREHHGFDERGNLIWGSSEFQFEYTDGGYSYQFVQFDGRVGTGRVRMTDYGEEYYSEEWTNANEGSHGTGWLEENGLWTDEHWRANDTEYHKETRNRETNQSVSREHRGYDENGTQLWGSSEFNFTYTDGECSYQFEDKDGRAGQRWAYLTGYGEECYREEWTNENDGSHGTGWLEENGLWTDESWWDNNTEQHKETRNRETDQTERREHYSYDENGELIWSEIRYNFAYDDARGEYTCRFEFSDGTSGDIRERFDGRMLSRNWTNEIWAQFGIELFDEENSIYHESVYSISQSVPAPVRFCDYDSEHNLLREENIEYIENIFALHHIFEYTEEGRLYTMQIVVPGGTPIYESTFDVSGNLTSVTRFEDGEPFMRYDLLTDPVLYLPLAMKQIESEAFADVEAKIVFLPDGIESVADDAFAEDVLFVVNDGSEAAELCSSMDKFHAPAHIDFN